MLKTALLSLFAASAQALPSYDLQARGTQLVGHPPNNFGCKSDHNPVVVLHGLSANKHVDLNSLQYHLNEKGFCTFTLTYGAHKLFPLVGGIKPMAESAKEIAAFIEEVASKTGKKVDLVGHSEGGVMTLYVPLTQSGIANKIERTVALGPAIHGAKYYGLTDLAWLGGDLSASMVEKVLRTVGAPAIADMATGGAVHKAFEKAKGNILQSGVKATVIMSKSDTLVEPETSIVDEKGVRNLYVQDYCPDDKVGHAGLAWDKGVWGIILNELTGEYDNKTVACEAGLPV
ncbi:alpha/beta-hydrolase [Periconia macrospinosa]|uniref:Alpha/beta-hydrolase n=1 Tax=Periconia macrospinosa TaxID=97972 RepID=A0A2V1DWC4_9PLEO|nr:alpha/beta-hydrolase [Periconia macrospinosa]